MRSLGTAIALLSGIGAWAGVADTGLVRHRALAGPVATATAIGAGLTDGTLLADVAATAARLAVGVGVGLIVGAPHGLGARAVSAQVAYDTPGLYAVIAVTGAVGWVLGRALLALERRIVFWRT